MAKVIKQKSDNTLSTLNSKILKGGNPADEEEQEQEQIVHGLSGGAKKKSSKKKSSKKKASKKKASKKKPSKKKAPASMDGGAKKKEIF